jgi:glycosyltransferase involved in cell wall biosynthesis
MAVNESLIAGTPVVCSDGCGAADLIDDPLAGEVVTAGMEGPLAKSLQRALSGGKITVERRRHVHAVAARHSPEFGVRLFLDGLTDRASSSR